MPRLSQETLAIVGAAIALAARILTTAAGLRTEIRTEVHALRAEARADRETFQTRILRLTEQQGVLTAHVENIRSQLAATR